MPPRVTVVRGDISGMDVDAVVNAANSSLLGGGGVDGAIHAAAGLELLEECRTLGGCPTGEARITKGYHLPARWVIHTVGPVWRGGADGEDDALARAYRSCFAISREKSFKTIAFPSISTGAYGFPLERACKIAVRETLEELKTNRTFERVYFVCFDSNTFDAYLEATKGPFPEAPAKP